MQSEGVFVSFRGRRRNGDPRGTPVTNSRTVDFTRQTRYEKVEDCSHGNVMVTISLHFGYLKKDKTMTGLYYAIFWIELDRLDAELQKKRTQLVNWLTIKISKSSLLIIKAIPR